ncbi:MAG: phosphopyruvate hydratase [Actinobacteria bacterium]|nr:phosphopyruvate hydratase [Actinomycetota bacterium]
MKIVDLLGYQVLDSRGRPTVAARITLADGSSHVAKVPSGASTGQHEAAELRDGKITGTNSYYSGLSVTNAVSNINNKIKPVIIGLDINLNQVDSKLIELDSSERFTNIGANSTLAVSLASSLAHAHSQQKSLVRFFQPNGKLMIPMPMINILSGGAHANRGMDIQDVLIIPIGAKSFSEAIAWAAGIREAAAKLGQAKGMLTHLVADEGGLGIAFNSVNAACEFVIEAIGSVGLKVGQEVSLALDIAATQFFSENNYVLASANKSYSGKEFVQFIVNLVNDFPIVSIEDPFAEDDWQSWIDFNQIAPKPIQILGDDLLTTNLSRLERAILDKAANAILIKPNQNGLVTNTEHVVRKAKEARFRTVVSARSGETEDSWLADLAVGWGAGQIKVGSTHGSERTSKWNRLLELELIEDCEFVNPFA